MPTAWRLVKKRLAKAAFDGEGAFRYGGRWNSPGTRVVYAAQSESLAALELLVHLEESQLLLSYVSIPVRFDESQLEIIDPTSLPEDWSHPLAPGSLARIGDRWASEQRSAVLQVPSAIVPRDANFLLNPNHPEAARLEIGDPAPFAFDPRLQ